MLQIVIVEVCETRRCDSMKVWIFIGYFIVAAMLHFVPNTIWKNTDHELRNETNYFLQETADTYIKFKELHPIDAAERHKEIISKLVITFDLICVLHKVHFDLEFGPAIPQEKSEPCEIEKSLLELEKILSKSVHLEADFYKIVSAFEKMYERDSYIILAKKMMSGNTMEPTAYARKFITKSEIEMLSNSVCNSLMNHVYPIDFFIQQIATQTIDDRLIPSHTGKDIITSHMLRSDLKSMTMNLFALLCAQDFYTKYGSINAAINLQFYLAIWNTSIMLLMYLNPTLIFSIIFHLQVLFCKLYKRCNGCACRFNTLFTFVMLETILENLRKELKKLTRYRYKKRK